MRALGQPQAALIGVLDPTEAPTTAILNAKIQNFIRYLYTNIDRDARSELSRLEASLLECEGALTAAVAAAAAAAVPSQAAVAALATLERARAGLRKSIKVAKRRLVSVPQVWSRTCNFVKDCIAF